MVNSIEEFKEAMKDPEFEKQILSGTKSLAHAIIIFRRIRFSDDFIKEVMSSTLATLAPIEKEKS